MAGLHRSSSALLSMASPARSWPVLLLRCSLMSCNCLFRCSSRQPLMLCPWTRDLALARGEAVHVSPLIFLSCTSGLPSLLGSPYEHCKVAEDFDISHGVSFCCQLSRAAICACLATGVCVGCFTLELLGDERHMLLSCPALADLRDECSPLVTECSGVMAGLVWARYQHMVSRYIIACLDRMSC